MSQRAFVGLGGNVGDAQATLRSGLSALAALPQTQLLAASRLYRTAPVGGIEQADFCNAVAALETEFAAADLLQALFAIERAHGRDRQREQRWGPRTLDLDLLLYGDEVIEVEGLIVPHPRMAERRFVLEPLLEIAPQIQIPGIGSAADALTRLP
ncbi:2-amino-4-hydroxy-6-hydroxymethyldihydropteridine diphosphokinase [Lysobacteraceae bacterium NML91-0268]|nr:2-amino-4-hydroxy-6-hydroxymethyldihydropteridine diphosphokinase [Xanthomonadaceae bacterium NML91-0268]